MEKLESLLSLYARQGLPSLPPEIMGTRGLSVRGEATDKMLSLERSWRELVQFSHELTKQDRILQEAIWEIFTTGMALDSFRTYSFLLVLALK